MPLKYEHMGSYVFFIPEHIKANSLTRVKPHEDFVHCGDASKPNTKCKASESGFICVQNYSAVTGSSIKDTVEPLKVKVNRTFDCKSSYS